VGFISALERRGFDPDAIFTVPVKRGDWIRVAGGLLDPGFYTNNALPTGKGYGWYIRRLKQCVDKAYEASGGERVLLIGHSAGGWLARAALGDGIWANPGPEEGRSSPMFGYYWSHTSSTAKCGDLCDSRCPRVYQRDVPRRILEG
jgi:hypothetical protein